MTSDRGSQFNDSSTLLAFAIDPESGKHRESSGNRSIDVGIAANSDSIAQVDRFPLPVATLASNSSAYTTGGDPTLLHRRWISAGGFGDVHEVCPPQPATDRSCMRSLLERSAFRYSMTNMEKAFARKLLLMPRIERIEIEHEALAIRKICENGSHSHIVEVLRLGQLRNTDYYFIDMELCDMNLAEYIHRPTPPNPSDSIPYFIKNAPPPLKAHQIWNIMKQIASGVSYIHTLNMVHRDLKPTNGKPLPMTS